MQIDYFKGRIREDISYEFPEWIDFNAHLNTKTGELRNGQFANYCEVDLKYFQSGRKMIQGSIHKFNNQCDFNGNDFDLFKLLAALKRLKKELNIHPKNIILENLEINLTVPLSYPPIKILNNLLFHGIKPFTQPLSTPFFFQCKKLEYYIKIYDKTEHYRAKLKEAENALKTPSLPLKSRKENEFLRDMINDNLQKNLLRFEIKFVRMERLNKVGITTLFDLLNANVYEKLLEILLELFDEVYFYDYTTDLSGMTNKEVSLMKDFRNPNYWKDLTKSQRYDKKQRFNFLTERYSENIKTDLRKILIQKFNELTEHYINYFSKSFQSDFRLFERSNIGSDSQNFNISRCVITGEDISMQKKGKHSYLKREGLRHLYLINPIRFWNLWNAHKNTISKLNAKTVEDKIILLETSIRRKFDNPRYNPSSYQRRNYNENQLQFFLN